MIGILQEIFKDMEDGVFDYTKDGKCVGCGRCCSNYLPLSKKEIEDIQWYIKEYHIKEQKHIFPTRVPIFDMTCTFLNEGKGNQKCVIYPSRPHVCRAFMCNQSLNEIKENREYFQTKRKICDMRETFFIGNN